MEQKEKKKQKHHHHHHQQQQQLPAAEGTDSAKAPTDLPFKPAVDVKGLRFGGQFIVKSFTIRRSTTLELLRLLSLPPSLPTSTLQHFPSTITFLPTNFTILAHHALHTLTLGLGTKKSKVLIFILENLTLKSTLDRHFPSIITLGEVNKKLIRSLIGLEMARFKFRKGCITFYIYAVRKEKNLGFCRVDDLRKILESVSNLKDFVDHTAMLALQKQRTIGFSPQVTEVH